jgi:stage V sporulation protein G
MNKGEWGKIKAFFDVQTDDGFVMKGFKLIHGINGLFVGFPSRKGDDEEYYDTIYAERELKDELSQMAIDYYGQEIMPAPADSASETNDDASMPMAETSNTDAAPADSTSETSDDAPTFTDDDIPF